MDHNKSLVARMIGWSLEPSLGAKQNQCSIRLLVVPLCPRGLWVWTRAIYRPVIYYYR